jgi:hypothetical protein
MTVREMLSRMDSAEISEWRAYFKLNHKEATEEAQRQSLIARAESNLRKR